MNAQGRNLIMDSVMALAAHGQHGPFVAVIPQIYLSPLSDAETIITDYGDVEIVRRVDVGPNMLYVMTKAAYEEQYG